MSLAAVQSAHLAPPRCARRGITPGPAWSAMSTAPRRAASAGSAPSFHSVTLPASTRTTFRCVAGEPTPSATSPLRGSLHPDAYARLRAMSCRVLVLEDSDSHASRQALRLFPRATVIGHANGHPTRYEDPALLTEVAGQLPRQRPMRCRYRDLDSLNPVGRPRPPPQEVRLNRWHENSRAVFPPTNPAHIPASSPRWRAIQRTLKVARARSTVVCSCDALSARASGGASAPGQPRSGFRGVVPMQDRDDFLLLLQQAPHRLFPAAANPGRRPGSESCGLRPLQRPETVLRTGSRAPSSHARKKRENRCPCVARTSTP